MKSKRILTAILLILVFFFVSCDDDTRQSDTLCDNQEEDIENDNPDGEDEGREDSYLTEDGDTVEDNLEDAAQVSCGEMNCEAGEFCWIQCTCCGVDVGMPSSADYECVPVPEDCEGDPVGCFESQSQYDNCNISDNYIDCPCA